MHSVPMGLYDFAGLATHEIDSARMSERASFGSITFMRGMLAKAPRWLTWATQALVAHTANAAYRRLEALTDRVARSAVFLEGAKVTLAEEFATSKKLPKDSLFDSLRLFRKTNQELANEAKKSIESLRRINESSRAADILVRLLELLDKSEAAAIDLEAIAEQAKHHYFVRKRIQELHADLDARLASFMDDDDDEMPGVAPNHIVGAEVH